MARFYITTPIFYVNDAPHIGTAYTTVTADAVARWHRLVGDDVLFVTGTDEHGLKMQRAAEANGLTPIEQADRYSARFAETWRSLDITNDDFIRTTEARHHTAVGELLQAAYDNGWIEPGTYEGLYCVHCEAYYVEADLLDGGLCPIHRKPVELLAEENYFFKLSAFTDRLLAWYEDNPVAVIPEAKRNEAVGLIRGGLNDVSISRTSITWGVPVPWDDKHVFYVWYDALINYATAAGYGADPERFAAWWPAVHHVIGKDILRFHCVYWPALCMAAGIEPPRQVAVHGFLLVGGEKMSKSALNQIAPADLVATFGVDGFRYHFLRDQAFGPDGDFSYEGMVARYNADLANNLGNLLSRVATVVGRKCGGIGPAPDPDSPLAAVVADAYAAAAAAWDRVAPSEALEATWRIVRETNAALEAAEPWKAEPGPAVDAVLGDALEALRVLAVLSSPATPRAAVEIWRRIGLSGSPFDARLPAAAAWGGYPGGLPVLVGPPVFPPHHLLTPVWADSHCHVPYEGVAVDALDEARAAGVARMISVGTDAAQSAAAVAVARAEPDVWATVGLHPHDAVDGVATLDGLLGDVSLLDPADPVVVAVGECGLDYHYDHSPRGVQRDVFAAQVALAHRLDLTLVIHTREAWDDTFAVLEAEGVPERTVFHCFTGGPVEARRALDVGAWLSFSGIVTFKTADDVRAAARLCPADRLLVETDAPYLAPVPHRGRPNRPALVTVVGAAVAAVRGEPDDVVAAATWAATAAAFRLPAGPAPGEVPGRTAAARVAVGGVMTLTRGRITALLDEHGLHPSRALGQNFVADPNTVRRIARLAGVGEGDHVVEIGAGLGSLTLALAETGASVTAIEVDRHVLPVLRTVVEPAGVRVVEGDALRLDWDALLAGDRWTLVANLPYNVATPLVADLLDGQPAIERMLVMVQREVGERLAAGPGDDAYGAVSVKVRYWATATVVGRVPPTVFIPRPNVDSALVAIRRRPVVAVDPGVVTPEALFAVVRAGFAQRRKMLRRALAGIADAAAFTAAGVDPAARAEELDVEAWGRLAAAAAPPAGVRR